MSKLFYSWGDSTEWKFRISVQKFLYRNISVYRNTDFCIQSMVHLHLKPIIDKYPETQLMFAFATIICLSFCFSFLNLTNPYLLVIEQLWQSPIGTLRRYQSLFFLLTSIQPLPKSINFFFQIHPQFYSFLFISGGHIQIIIPLFF